MSNPILTNSIDQSFFIDALNGPQNVTTFLNNFPDTVYSKAVDSHLSIIMYALLGPAGAGLLKQEYFEQRLQTEIGNVGSTALDALYTDPFGFQRLTEESYAWDTASQLLPIGDRAGILSADASFRNRARLWMQAIRAGGSVLGISLAASSGLGQQVEAVENYKALFDQYTDAPLGIPYVGSTNSLDEIILIPRNNVPKNVVQTISFPTIPTSGQFSIIVSIGPPYTVVNMSVTFNTNGTVTVPNSKLFHVGGWFSGPNIVGVGNVWVCTNILGSTTITTSPSYSTTLTTISGNVNIGLTETTPIAYNATANDIRAALGALTIIGGLQNVQCFGGPLPYFPVQVIFTGTLANTPIKNLVINTTTDAITGSTGLTPSSVVPLVETSVAGLKADGLSIQFAESDLALMLEAVDILRPQTTFISVNNGQSLYTRQGANSYYADQTYTEVDQYVTGAVSIDWPPVDGATDWIEAGVEHESPQLAGGYSSQYTNFHNVLTAISYTEHALSDAHYNTPLSASVQPFYSSYFATHVGQFNQAQQLLYPFLSQYQNTSMVFDPTYSIAVQPNQPQITSVTNDLIALINNSYPASYLNLPGANYQSVNSGPFWASDERTSGTDYLEIDLGTVQPVNFIYFEATNKPYSIDVAYETLDQPLSREFIEAVISDVMPSTTSLVYSASQVNPWTTVYLPITNALGTMVYTRYIRIGFTRTSQGEPFLSGTQLLPYSIEVKNLRIGRVVNSFGLSFTSTT